MTQELDKRPGREPGPAQAGPGREAGRRQARCASSPGDPDWVQHMRTLARRLALSELPVK